MSTKHSSSLMLASLVAGLLITSVPSVQAQNRTGIGANGAAITLGPGAVGAPATGANIGQVGGIGGTSIGTSVPSLNGQPGTGIGFNQPAVVNPTPMMGASAQLGAFGAVVNGGAAVPNGPVRFGATPSGQLGSAGTVVGKPGVNGLNIPVVGNSQFGSGGYGLGEYGNGQFGTPVGNEQFAQPIGNTTEFGTRFGNAPLGTPLGNLQNAVEGVPGSTGYNNGNYGAFGYTGAGGYPGGYGLGTGGTASAGTVVVTPPPAAPGVERLGTNLNTEGTGDFGGVYGGSYGYTYGQ